MAKIPQAMRQIICGNIRACRMKKFPGRGGSKQCAAMFGVSQQQWSPWETGQRVPDELRLAQLADFFGVTVEYFCQEHAENRPIPGFAVQEDAVLPRGRENDDSASPGCPFYRAPRPGSPREDDIRNLCWLAQRLLGAAHEWNISVKLSPNDGNRTPEANTNAPEEELLN